MSTSPSLTPLPKPEPTEREQVIAFLSGATTEHLHATSRLIRARGECDRLRKALAAAEQTVREAERDRDASADIVRDALSLAREMG